MKQLLNFTFANVLQYIRKGKKLIDYYAFFSGAHADEKTREQPRKDEDRRRLLEERDQDLDRLLSMFDPQVRQLIPFETNTVLQTFAIMNYTKICTHQSYFFNILLLYKSWATEAAFTGVDFRNNARWGLVS